MDQSFESIYLNHRYGNLYDKKTTTYHLRDKSQQEHTQNNVHLSHSCGIKTAVTCTHYTCHMCVICSVT